MSRTELKKAAGYRAADLVESGMLIGLGTGSTVFFLVEKLIQRCKEGLKIQAIASSTQTQELAKKGGIPLLNPQEVSFLDLTIDGADEIDPQKRMIKGAGGAHVREKILAQMSRELIVIVDETKLVDALGKAKLPVEILPFGAPSTIHQIEKLGHMGTLRKTSNGTPFITDNGNLLFDIHFQKTLSDPEKENDQLMRIPGIVDTGFFFHLAGRVIVSFFDGQIVIRP